MKQEKEIELRKEEHKVVKIIGSVILLSALVFINIKVRNKLMNK